MSPRLRDGEPNREEEGEKGIEEGGRRGKAKIGKGSTKKAEACFASPSGEWKKGEIDLGQCKNRAVTRTIATDGRTDGGSERTV